MAERGLRLGLVIDLTDTDRYYDHGDIEGMCIEYEKVNCPGRGFVDRDDLVKTFIAVVDNFINSNPDDGILLEVPAEILVAISSGHGADRGGVLCPKLNPMGEWGPLPPFSRPHLIRKNFRLFLKFRLLAVSFR